MTTGEEQSRSDCSVQKRPTDGRDRRRRTARRRVRGTVPQGLRGVLRRWGQRFGAEVSPSSEAAQVARPGTVTAEFAVILPVVALLAGTLVFTGSAVVTRLDCQEAVAAGVRLMTQVPDDAQSRLSVRRTVLSHAPRGSTLERMSSVAGVKLTLSCPIGRGALRVLPARIEQSAIGLPQGETR